MARLGSCKSQECWECCFCFHSNPNSPALLHSWSPSRCAPWRAMGSLCLAFTHPTLPHVPLQLESLSLCAMARNGLFVFGIDSIPDTWQQLRRLKALELR